MGSETKLYINNHGELCQQISSKYHKQIEMIVQGMACQDWTEMKMYSQLNITNFIKPFGKPVIK